VESYDLFVSVTFLHIISGFRREVDGVCALLGCYAAYSGNSLEKFRDNLSVPYPRVKKSKKEAFFWIAVKTTAVPYSNLTDILALSQN